MMDHDSGPSQNLNGFSHSEISDSTYGSTDSFVKNGDVGDGWINENKGQNKKVTFSVAEPQKSSRPSVPGPSGALDHIVSRPTMDSQFTEDISRQMRVPSQIRPYNENGGSFFAQGDDLGRGGNSAYQMSVPDRILVAGNDQHFGVREQRPRELDFDDMLYGLRSDAAVMVQTPPRTLTVNQHSFPSTDSMNMNQIADGPMIAPFSASALSDNVEQSLYLQAERNMASASKLQKSSALRSASGAVTSNASRSPYPDTPTTRMVIDLYKRVEVLERENYQRYLREMVGYALLIGFVAIKGMSFFLKR